MEFLVTTTNAVTFNNKELQKATNTVLKLGDTIKSNWFAIPVDILTKYAV